MPGTKWLKTKREAKYLWATGLWIVILGTFLSMTFATPRSVSIPICFLLLTSYFPAPHLLLCFPQLLPEPLETQSACVVPSPYKVQETFSIILCSVSLSFNKDQHLLQLPSRADSLWAQDTDLSILHTRVCILTLIIMQISEDFECKLLFGLLLN